MRYHLLSLLLLFVLNGLAQEDLRTRYFPVLEEKPGVVPDKKKIWVFIMAGQSNMAGRGQVEPQDTVTNPRILALNRNGELMLAKEPLNLNEPAMVGLDCGVSFARKMLEFCPPDVSILLVHTAVGGSSIRKWIDDSVYREVPLFSNFKKRLGEAKKLGTIKGVIWHQGEADANAKGLPVHQSNLEQLFGMMRKEAGQRKMPVLMGELGYFSKTVHEQFMQMNGVFRAYSKTDSRTAVVSTEGLDHKGDFLHFNTAGQREIGRRYAAVFADKFLKKPLRRSRPA
jgi:hypothetical protein